MGIVRFFFSSKIVPVANVSDIFLYFLTDVGDAQLLFV